jgi:acyl carrier protein
MEANKLLDKEEFFRKMDNLLNTAPGTVHSGQALSSLESWDSLTILEFIVMADNDYSSDVLPADIAGCKTVDELAELTFAKSSAK